MAKMNLGIAVVLSDGLLIRNMWCLIANLQIDLGLFSGHCMVLESVTGAFN